VRSRSQNDDHQSDHRENCVYNEAVMAVLWLDESKPQQEQFFFPTEGSCTNFGSLLVA
jgi:hypothetical protein